MLPSCWPGGGSRSLVKKPKDHVRNPPKEECVHKYNSLTENAKFYQDCSQFSLACQPHAGEFSVPHGGGGILPHLPSAPTVKRAATVPIETFSSPHHGSPKVEMGPWFKLESENPALISPRCSDVTVNRGRQSQ